MTAVTRDEHLQWCKNRAFEILNTGDREGAIASMTSDLGKWREPLYDSTTLSFLTLDALLFRKSTTEVKSWIEGFN